MEDGDPVDYSSDMMDNDDIWVTPGDCELEKLLDLPPLGATTNPTVSIGGEQVEAFSPSDFFVVFPKQYFD